MWGSPSCVHWPPNCPKTPGPQAGPCQAPLRVTAPNVAEPLSLERAELLQEEGNLALNLCPSARPGWGAWGERKELSFLSRDYGPKRTQVPKRLIEAKVGPCLDWTSLYRAPKPAAPTPCLSPSATLLPHPTPISLLCAARRYPSVPGILTEGAAAWPG